MDPMLKLLREFINQTGFAVYCVLCTVCRYPWQIFFIIIMEVCERFSYYGMNGKDIAFKETV
jgi:dipeptide/tripeptide permease